jgi:hypothetical protein
VVVRSAERVVVGVERMPEGTASYSVVVYAPTRAAPVEILASCKPMLTDDECAEVAAALGFGG